MDGSDIATVQSPAWERPLMTRVHRTEQIEFQRPDRRDAIRVPWHGPIKESKVLLLWIEHATTAGNAIIQGKSSPNTRISLSMIRAKAKALISSPVPLVYTAAITLLMSNAGNFFAASFGMQPQASDPRTTSANSINCSARCAIYPDFVVAPQLTNDRFLSCLRWMDRSARLRPHLIGT